MNLETGFIFGFGAVFGMIVANFMIDFFAFFFKPEIVIDDEQDDEYNKKTIYDWIEDAIEKGDLKRVATIIRRSRDDISECMQLELAAMYNSVEAMQFLIDIGVDINSKNDKGESALHIAAFHNSIEVMQLLINAGVNINSKDNRGDTPLHESASICDSKESAQLLINLGVDINSKNNEGETPLHIVSKWNSLQVAQLLVSSGANVNINVNNWAPLHKAVNENRFQIVRLLLRAGANLNLQDDKGKMPLDYAKTDEMRKLFN